MLGESSAVADALTSVSFSGEVCLVLTVGFVLFRLKMSGCVESEEAIYYAKYSFISISVLEICK